MAQLPKNPSLDRLRRKARAFQRACRAGEPSAVAKLAAALGDAEPANVPLSRAQTAVARQYGLPSWPKLVAEVAARRARHVAAPRQDAETLAEQWFTLAELDSPKPLNQALSVGKARIEAARDVMRRDPARYLAFQRALIRGLGSSARDRFECAHALDLFGDASTRRALVPLMNDPVARVRWMAMHALSCHACGEKPGALEADIRERVIEAARSDPSVRVRQHAATALALAHETSAVPVLREMLARETNAKVLRGVTWALSELTRPPRPDRRAPAGL
jgi:HEAT repeat protein